MSRKIDYFKIIHKYIAPYSRAYKIYLPHVVLVTNKALRIATRLGLSPDSLQFLEEVGMLHDIGSVKVHAPDLGLTGNLPYIMHGIEGRKILEKEGLPRHALAVERHIGVGIYKEDVERQNLPLPARDMVPETLEERIISYADLFFSKTPGKQWIERPLEIAREKVAIFGKRQAQTFDKWAKEFESVAI